MTDHSDYDALLAEHQARQAPDDAARDEGHQAISSAVLRMARAAGAQIRERTAWPDSALTEHYPEPVAGMRFARMLADAARHKEREYIKRSRETGMSWRQIGEALGLAEAAVERGIGLDDAAFDYATDAEHASPFAVLSFPWTCQECGEMISDRGMSGGHPEDDEPGHSEGCARLAAAVAEHDARWAGQRLRGNGPR